MSARAVSGNPSCIMYVYMLCAYVFVCVCVCVYDCVCLYTCAVLCVIIVCLRGCVPKGRPIIICDKDDVEIEKKAFHCLKVCTVDNL